MIILTLNQGKRHIRKAFVLILAILMVTGWLLNAVFSSAHAINTSFASTSHGLDAGLVTVKTQGLGLMDHPENHRNGQHHHFSCGNHFSDSLDSHRAYQLPPLREISLAAFEPLEIFLFVYLNIFIPPENLA